MKTRTILTASIALLAVITARAQTWDGGSGVNSNIGTAANWNPDAVPANNGTANLIFGGVVRLTPNFDSVWSVNGVTFNNTAGAFTFGGSRPHHGRSRK